MVLASGEGVTMAGAVRKRPCDETAQGGSLPNNPDWWELTSLLKAALIHSQMAMSPVIQ